MSAVGVGSCNTHTVGVNLAGILGDARADPEGLAPLSTEGRSLGRARPLPRKNEFLT